MVITERKGNPKCMITEKGPKSGRTIDQMKLEARKMIPAIEDESLSFKEGNIAGSALRYVSVVR